MDRSSQTSPRESIGRTGSYPSLATPSPRAWSCQTSDYQTVSDKTVSTQDSTLSIPSSNSDSSYRAEDVQTQVSLPERVARTTSITGLDYPETILDIAVSVETDISEDTVVEATQSKDESTQANDGEQRSIACQADNTQLFNMPEITAMKDSTESQSSVQVKEESSQVCRRDIIEEMDPFSYQVKTIRTDIACTGGNYEEYPIEKPVVPRYSAMPRTNSMLVNTSSLEYSSDSELSLTDSLEDPEEYRSQVYKRKHSRHDERMVRGEVSVEQEKRRLPKARDAYAYFLTLTGEEDTIREYSIPDWLRDRLRRREEEIKKIYEDKLSRQQQIGYFRRRKKCIKRIKQKNSYSSSEKTNKKSELITPDNHLKPEKTVRFDDYTTNNNINNINPSTSDKCAIRVLNGNNMGLEPKIDNIHRNNNNHNVINNHNNNNNNNHNNNNGINSSQLFIQTETGNRTNGSSNLVQISEVIKIEMSDNRSTIITKEKQINLTPETSLQQSGSETIKNELSNSTKSVITKLNNSQVSAELVDTNTLHSFRQVSVKAPENEPEPTTNVTESATRNEEKQSRTNPSDQPVEEQLSNTSKFKESRPEGTESKIEIDRKIADVLITALEENTKAHQLRRTEESSADKPESEPPQKYQTAEVQTDVFPDSNNVEEHRNVDKSNNTEPYLVSISIQTSDKELSSEDKDEYDNMSYQSEFESQEEDVSGYQLHDGVSSFDISVDENVKMVDKACNTVEAVSISTQTNESILQSEDILNVLKREKPSKKKDVQFPPQVIKQIITGTGEYKTLEQPPNSRGQERNKSSGGRKGKVSKGTNTDEAESVMENNKNIINNNDDILQQRTAPTPFCKNVFPNKQQQRKSQVLELNTPTCSCHMCTLQKISPRSETSKSKIPQTRKATESSKEEKRNISKYGGRRSNVTGTKFRMFESIPEERSASTDSFPEDNKSNIKMEEKAVLTETHLVDQVVQVGSNNATVATNTDPEIVTPKDPKPLKKQDTPSKESELTQTENTQAMATQTVSTGQRKSNLVIGRFRSESPMTVRQYKGRASLSAGHLEGQEELLTLSKGWINFYLLKDNFDLSDSNTEEPPSVSGRRRVKIEEDKVEEYTLEIEATPEPSRGLLPSLKRNEGRVTLPEIHSSSSASSPESEEQRKTEKKMVGPLPGVRKSKKTRRIDLKREAVTQLRRGDRASAPPQTRSVEVARSEQSISSITSSTVILSESPPPQQLKLPEKRIHRQRVQRTLASQLQNGSSWTVTVAGSSGSGNEPPPDVEMKLSFGKYHRRQEDCSYQYQVARPKRQGRMIEEFSHVSRNEKLSSVQCVQDLTLQAHQPKSCQERTRGGHTKDNFSYEEDYINRLSSRSRYSTEDGSETTGELHVTGLAITPEKKPRVPTQSERDILRPQRYKFTR